MFLIIGIIWILISFPVWIIGTIIYLFGIGLFHILKILFICFLAIIGLFNGQNLDYQLYKIKITILNSLIDFFPRYNDLFIHFWEFGIYDHPYWAIVFSIVLLFIYYVWPSD